MKNKYILLTALFAATFASGCKPTEQAGDAPAPQFEQVKKETKEAVQSAKDYAYAQKSEFAEKMKSEIAGLNTQMDQLAAKVETSSAATKEEAKAKLQALREKTAGLNKKLDGVKEATEATWEDTKSGVKQGYEELRDSFNQARAWFSDKIAGQ